MTSLRTLLRRRTCNRWDHQWGEWEPTWQIFVQARVCEHCGGVETRTPLDAAAAAMRNFGASLGKAMTRDNQQRRP